MFKFYRLDKDKKPVPIGLNEIELILEDQASRRVDFTTHKGWSVSTVFLAIDHNIFGPEPELFETMVSSDTDSEIYERYPTYEYAAKGHSNCVYSLLIEETGPEVFELARFALYAIFFGFGVIISHLIINL